MVPSYAVLKWCRHMKTYFLLVKILVVPWVEDKTKCRLVIETSRVLVPTSVGPQSLTMHCLHSHCQIISTYFCMFRCSFTHVQQVISWNVWKHRKKSKWCRSSDIKNISVSAWGPWTPSPWWPNHPTTHSIHSIQVTNTIMVPNPTIWNSSGTKPQVFPPSINRSAKSQVVFRCFSRGSGTTLTSEFAIDQR
jgi:hypothetical protein